MTTTAPAARNVKRAAALSGAGPSPPSAWPSRCRAPPRSLAPSGNAGNDEIDGGSGDDKVVGLSGDDDLEGSSGQDRLYGKDGDVWERQYRGDDG